MRHLEDFFNGLLDRTAARIKQSFEDPEIEITSAGFVAMAQLAFVAPRVGQFTWAEQGRLQDATHALQSALDCKPSITIEDTEYTLHPEKTHVFDLTEIVESYIQVAQSLGRIDPDSVKRESGYIEFRLGEEYPFNQLIGAQMAFIFDPPTQRQAEVAIELNGEVATMRLDPSVVGEMVKEKELLAMGRETPRKILVSSFGEVLKEILSR